MTLDEIRPDQEVVIMVNRLRLTVHKRLGLFTTNCYHAIRDAWAGRWDEYDGQASLRVCRRCRW